MSNSNTADTITILGIPGSLRKASLNHAALRAASELTPEGTRLNLFPLNGIPPYDEDVRAAGLPDAVQKFRAAIAAADALLFSTPEYNYSVPGVLKNAIDWASRPPEQPFEGKPIAIMSVSPGRLGGVRAQYHLRQCFIFLNSLVMNRPEVMIAGAGDLFDEHGNLGDDATREHIATLLQSLVAWTRQQRPRQA